MARLLCRSYRIAVLLALAALVDSRIAWNSTPSERMKQIMDLFDAGRTNLAALSLRRLLGETLPAANVQVQAEAHLALGEVALRRALLVEGRKEAGQAMTLFRSISDRSGIAKAKRLLGHFAEEAGDSQSAAALYTEALQEFEVDSLQEEKALTLLALAQASRQFNQETKTLDELALALAQTTGSKLLECEARQNLARLYYFQADNNAAERENNVAESLAKDLHNSFELAHVLESRAILKIENGQLSEGLALCKRAARFATETEDRHTMIDLSNQEGVAFLEQRNFRTATQYFEGGLMEARKFGLVNLADKLQDNLAICRVGQRDFRGAIGVLEAAVREHPNAAQAEYRFLTLAQSHLELKEYQSALEAVNQALRLAQAANNKLLLPDLRHLKAHIEDGLGENDLALSDARGALEMIEDLRSHLAPDDFTKRGFADATQELYGEMIGLLQKNGSDREALELSERARARALLELLASRDAEQRPPDQEPQSNQSGAVASVLPPAAPPKPLTLAEMTSVARRLNATILSYWVETEGTYIWVLAPTGELHSTRIPIKAERLGAAVRRLWPFEAATTRGGGPAVAIPDPVRQNRTSIQTRGGMSLELDQAHRSGWRELYRLLIQPVDKWLPEGSSGEHLMIVSNGPLLLLPFASLQDSHGRYLLERYALAYSPSLSILPLTERKTTGAVRQPQYLLVADPAPLIQQPHEPHLPRLPGARREVETVSRLLVNGSVQMLEGTDARIDRVVALSNQSTVIHLATHALAQDEHNLGSVLVLAPGKQAGMQNGRLTARAIYGLKLDADLVFLSACRSGAGTISSDGVVGLTRALLYAGAASVIVSVWDVADEPTARLVADFYRNWLQGKGKAVALREAQLHLLRTLRGGGVKIHTESGDLTLPEDPVFWASFTLQGEP